MAAKCYACHGPDEASREAGLRLDDRAEAIDFGAIVPMDASASEMMRRIASNDPDEVMPPPHAGEPLDDSQRERFASWINDGAKYERHWAFVPPKSPPIPQIQTDRNDHGRAFGGRNPIDAFIAARADANGLAMSSSASRYDLVRRLYLDLIGIPPTPAQADAWVQSDRVDAYPRLVDRLLASPRYGERFARPWLDLARYADTNGYEKDRPRTVWPYRDWVIASLNDDVPFDQFSIDQLAGDMRPDATTEQLIATGFHRNTMLNEEGGIDPLEFRYHAVVDRVATTGTIWMGLSTGCAQCHTHKYDPITHTDYFALFALLNNADEPDLTITDDDAALRRGEMQREIDRLTDGLAERFPPDDAGGTVAQRRSRNLQRSFERWVERIRRSSPPWIVVEPTAMQTNLPYLRVQDDGSVLSTGDITKRDTFTLTFDLSVLPASDQPIRAIRLEALPDDRLPAGGPGRAYYEGRRGDFFLSEFNVTVDGDPVALVDPSHSFAKLSVGSGKADAANVIDGEGSTGWSTSGGEGKPHEMVLRFDRPLERDGVMEVSMLFERHFAASLGRFRISVTGQTDASASAVPDSLRRDLIRSATSVSDAIGSNADERLREALLRYYLSVAPEIAGPRAAIEKLRRRMPPPTRTLVMRSRPADHRRVTHRHHRGEYLNPREVVTPGVPAFLRRDGAENPRDRLELARWLVSRDNPMVARAVVDRAWRSFFGRGLHSAPDDFGTQSDPPTHPDLIDALAVGLIESGWSIKWLHRKIVTSATYRQSSIATADVRRRDPENRHFARGPRFRVPAESVRDAMLSASGLLVDRMGGPGVRPPQPAGVTEAAYGSPKWPAAEGENRYRRSIYTFTKRTAPFAASAIFDAPSGEVCVARRDRSNTPLQALTLLNDEMFLEMARGLVGDVIAKHPDAQTRELTRRIVRRLLTRPPSETELRAITNYFQTQRERLRSGELDAAAILASANDGPDTSLLSESDPALMSESDAAAWVLVARAVMNLDEAITKP